MIFLKNSPFVLNSSPQVATLTQSQFLSGEPLEGIQNFLSPRMVTLQRLKNPVCTTIYQNLGK